MRERRPAEATEQERSSPCTRCGVDVQMCAFCENPDCETIVCYRCVRRGVRQSIDHPHTHGG